MPIKPPLFSLLIFALPFFNVPGQFAESEPHQAAVCRFEKQYNASDHEAVFASFAAVMQEALPLLETRKFLASVKSGYGSIIEREFLRRANNTAFYKMRCERGTFVLTLTADADENVSGLFIRPYREIDSPKMERTKTGLILPFRGEWTVVWGGDTPEQNYHSAGHLSQKYAVDFIIRDENRKSYRLSGESNNDFHAFEKELIAPCNGEVVLAVDGIKDNTPGQLNPFFPTGNTVILKTENLEYLCFAHFKQHSIKVTQGQRVRQGDLLGLCGNSGNSSEPHLHFHVQNVEDMNAATGVKCYFSKIIVDGEMWSDYSPLQNDKVRNP